MSPSYQNPDSTVRYFWSRAPRAVGRVSPVSRELLTDSGYLLAWPWAAAVVPPACLLLGVLVGLLHPGQVYSGSVGILVVLVLVGAVGATAGSWFCVGFLPADLILRPSSWSSQEVSKLGLLVVDALLVLLVVLAAASAVRLGPPLASRVVMWLRRAGTRPAAPASARARLLGDMVMNGFVYGMLLYAWLHSTPTLLRPAYTWASQVPDTKAVQSLQANVWPLVLLGFVGVAGRTYLMWLAASRPAGAARFEEAETGDDRERPEYPAWLWLAVRAVIAVVLAAGLFTHLWEAVVLGGTIAVGLWLQHRLGDYEPWVRAVVRVPAALRLLAVLVVSQIMALIVLPSLFSSTNDLWPVFAATTILLLLNLAVFPERERSSLARGEGSR
jgi:hypothetical protein